MAMKFVQLTADTTRVITEFACSQPITSDKPGYTQIDSADARYVAWQAALAAQANAAAALAAGCAIVSASTPTLNGTYAVDPQSRSNLQALLLGYLLRSAFPGGGSTFAYPDASGAPHVMTQPQMEEIGSALEDYVAALDAWATTPGAGAPAQPVTIA